MEFIVGIFAAVMFTLICACGRDGVLAVVAVSLLIGAALLWI